MEILDGMKSALKSIWEGFLFALCIWGAFVLINAFLGLCGLSIVLALPGIFAYFVNPFVVGPVIGIVKLLFLYIKG